MREARARTNVRSPRPSRNYWQAGREKKINYPRRLRVTGCLNDFWPKTKFNREFEFTTLMFDDSCAYKFPAWASSLAKNRSRTPWRGALRIASGGQVPNHSSFQPSALHATRIWSIRTVKHLIISEFFVRPKYAWITLEDTYCAMYLGYYTDSFSENEFLAHWPNMIAWFPIKGNIC